MSVVPIRPKPNSTLAELATEINDALQRGDDARISAGRMLLDAYEQVVGRVWEAGNRANVPGWRQWLKDNVNWNPIYCTQNMRIAASSDPVQALEDLRASKRKKPPALSNLPKGENPAQGMEEPEEETDESEVPFAEQPAVKAFIKALWGLDYDQKLFVWKHVLPKFNPRNLSKEPKYASA